MSRAPHPTRPRAPTGGPPARAAAFDSWRSLRVARGPLLLATGTGFFSYPVQTKNFCGLSQA
jgi:hypothetical protein